MTAMGDPHRSAFGELLVDPSALSRAEQIDVVRRLAGSLQASSDREMRWLGRLLSRRTTEGGDLEVALGLRGERGQRAAESLTHQARCDSALLRLSALVGTDARGVRILKGLEAAPIEAADTLAELRELRAPVSRAAFARARIRSRANS
jgi:hypothetical protein